ncbi:hypothetical protein TNCV_2614171 [Trichonephila clavipes]|nr:hypothetical protein TNCV_2614171 [Trichonephila clavipes]
MPTTSSSMTVVTTSSSTQAHLLPSTKVPTIPCEFQPPIPISTSATSTANSLHSTSNSRASTVSKAAKNLKQSRKFFLKKGHITKPKPEIEIKMNSLPPPAHKPKKGFIYYTSEDEDMILCDVDESLIDCHVKSGFMHYMTPTTNRKK